MVKIDVCTLTSVANVRILDERKPTREKRKAKSDEVLCMTKLDALPLKEDTKCTNIIDDIIHTVYFCVTFEYSVSSSESLLLVELPIA